MKSFAVIGLGRFGTQLATRLFELDCDVLAIDESEECVNAISDRVTRAVRADAKNRDVLKSLGVGDCDCAIVAIGSNLEASVLITMNLKSLNVPQIICKSHSAVHSEILEKLGATQVIIPEHAVADKLAKSLSSPDVLDFIQLSADFGIVELRAPESFWGKTIRKLNVRAKYGVNIIAIKKDGTIKVSPTADYIVEKDGILVLLGEYASIEKLKKA